MKFDIGSYQLLHSLPSLVFLAADLSLESMYSEFEQNHLSPPFD